VVDHDAFRWTDKGWQAPPLASAVVYEVHVGTFTPQGTFQAAIDKLDYLADLGITHVELMPVNEFPGSRRWGYDGVGLYAPHHTYGGPVGLKLLIDACHSRGLAVILDVVYNHLGPSGNYLGRFGPYFTDRYRTLWGPGINFDGPGSDEVRRFFCDNALMWLRDYHADGLRLDAVHAITDTSAVHILEQLSEEVDQLEAQLGRHLVLIAESDLNDPRIVKAREVGGYGIDAQWNDDFHHALHAVMTGERSGYYQDFGSLDDLAKALTAAFVYDGRYSLYRARRHGRPASGLSGSHFLAYLQNHDQIGNRAKGERSTDLMSAGRLKVAAALVLTSSFVPMLFQGEEWGASTPFLYFTDHGDVELGKAVTEGRRAEFAGFGWKPEEIPDPQARETFEASKLRWEEAKSEPHVGLLEWHRQLIRLRHTLSDLRNGRMNWVHVRYDQERQWIAVERGPVTLACNLLDKMQRVPLLDGRPRHLVLASDLAARVGGSFAELPPDCVAVLGPRERV